MSKANRVRQKATNTNSSAFVGGNVEGALIINPPPIVEDMGLIAVAFEYIIANISVRNDYDKSKPPAKWVETKEKIKINFSDEEATYVAEYYGYALPKVKMIEEYFQTLDTESQDDLHSHLFEIYTKNKLAGMAALQNLHSLFEEFTPPRQKNNPQYKHMAKALVLFFFEDCTIFEKTQQEQKTMQLAFWQL